MNNRKESPKSYRSFTLARLWTGVFILFLSGLLFLFVSQVLINQQQQDQINNLANSLSKNEAVTELASYNGDAFDRDAQKLVDEEARTLNLNYLIVYNDQDIIHSFDGMKFFSLEKLMDTQRSESILRIFKQSIGLGDNIPIRATVPIIDQDNQEIGKLFIGKNQEPVIYQGAGTYLIVFLILGVVILFVFYRHLTRRLEQERTHQQSLDAYRQDQHQMYFIENSSDGIFFTDSQGTISYLNNAARDAFEDQLEALQIITYKIEGEDLLSWVTSLKNRDILLSRSKIEIDGEYDGSFYLIKRAVNEDELDKQLDLAYRYSQVIQRENHEFLNMLHVIYNLVDLGETDKLKKYLDDILNPRENLMVLLAMNLKNPVLSGYLVELRNDLAQRDIHLQIEISASIPGSTPRASDQIIQIIDEAIEPLLDMPKGSELLLTLNYEGQKLTIEIESPNNSIERMVPYPKQDYEVNS